MKTTIFIILAFTFLISCREKKTENNTAVGESGWLEGTTEEKFGEVADQLGGFSRTMIEVAYRYSELYWAGMDENWDYADHQIEHMVEAMEAGLKRRPLRAESAENFMKESIPRLESIILKKDKEEFIRGFKTFTLECNGCHAKEGESAIMIREPQTRLSPVQF